jgi:hypothetical protein
MISGAEPNLAYLATAGMGEIGISPRYAGSVGERQQSLYDLISGQGLKVHFRASRLLFNPTYRSSPRPKRTSTMDARLLPRPVQKPSADTYS